MMTYTIRADRTPYGDYKGVLIKDGKDIVYMYGDGYTEQDALRAADAAREQQVQEDAVIANRKPTYRIDVNAQDGLAIEPGAPPSLTAWMQKAEETLLND